MVKTHFDTTLRQQNQPHSFIIHMEFIRRTEIGPAIFTVKDIKLGRQTSTVHVTLSQKDREEVLGYFTNCNIAAETGISYSTVWQPNPPILPADVSKFANNTDQHWAERKTWPFASFRKASTQIRSFFPRHGQAAKSIVDEWLCLRNGENFTNEALGFVCDMFPQMAEFYRDDGVDPYGIELEQRMSIEEQEQKIKAPGAWYPTLVLNLDVKKALPQEGVKWLNVRLQAKQIKNGRFDLEIIIRDATGDVVALSHHVCLAVSASRNIAKRRTAEQTKL